MKKILAQTLATPLAMLYISCPAIWAVVHLVKLNKEK